MMYHGDTEEGQLKKICLKPTLNVADLIKVTLSVSLFWVLKLDLGYRSYNYQ